MCSIIGVGERLRKVLGQIDLGTLDSGERSLPFGLFVFLYLLNSKILLSVYILFVFTFPSVNQYGTKPLSNSQC